MLKTKGQWVTWHGVPSMVCAQRKTPPRTVIYMTDLGDLPCRAITGKGKVTLLCGGSRQSSCGTLVPPNIPKDPHPQL